MTNIVAIAVLFLAFVLPGRAYAQSASDFSLTVDDLPPGYNQDGWEPREVDGISVLLADFSCDLICRRTVNGSDTIPIAVKTIVYVGRDTPVPSDIEERLFAPGRDAVGQFRPIDGPTIGDSSHWLRALVVRSSIEVIVYEVDFSVGNGGGQVVTASTVGTPSTNSYYENGGYQSDTAALAEIVAARLQADQ